MSFNPDSSNHNSQDNPGDLCASSLNADTNPHFLLKCPSYNEHRQLLFQTLNPILLANNINHRNDCEFMRLLLYGNEKLNFHPLPPPPHILSVFVHQQVSINIYHPVSSSPVFYSGVPFSFFYVLLSFIVIIFRNT